MLYYFRHALAVNVEPCPEPVEIGDIPFWFVIFFGLVLSLKLQIELSEIHRSRNGVSYLKSRVSHWSGEKLFEPTRSETRYSRCFASEWWMISGVRSDPWASEAATEVRSDAQPDYAVEIRSDPQFHQCKRVADWLRFFYATCWLALW